MRIFRKIHLWLSVPFGVIITLICFSGAMLVFEPEITRGLKGDIYYVTSAEGEPIDMKELMETVKATLPDSVSITGVTVFDDKDRTYQVSLSKPRRASLFIDQYSGKITGKYERIGFFSAMFRLHRWLLDSGNPHGGGLKVGKLLVGVSTLVFVIALVTGVVVWYPRAKRNLAHSLSISFKDGWRGLWKGFHVAGGMYALILLLAMSLTGLTWSFNWYRTVFYAVCGVEHTPRNFNIAEKDHHKNKSEGGTHDSVRRGDDGNNRHGRDFSEHRGEGNWRSEFSRWQQIYNELKAQNPGAAQITVGNETANVTLGTAGNSRSADRYGFNRRSGEITPVMKYVDSAPADKLRGWIYSIHTGSLGGIITRILWFLGALLGASLPLTGYYIWLIRGKCMGSLFIGKKIGNKTGC